MWKNQAINLLNRRIKTIHSTMPRAKEIAEKIDDLLPLLRAYETPVSYRDARTRANDYQNALLLHSRANAFLIELNQGEENVVSQVTSQLLRGVVSDTESYLERHQADA